MRNTRSKKGRSAGETDQRRVDDPVEVLPRFGYASPGEAER
jgi:hypothetical protein